MQIFHLFSHSAGSLPWALGRVHICSWMLCECEWGMQKWKKYWCGLVAKAQWTVFVYVANVRWTAKCYLFGVGSSKKNTFAMLGVHLSGQMPNKPFFAHMEHLFGFPSVPYSHLRTNVDPALGRLQTAKFSKSLTCTCRFISSWCDLNLVHLD